MLYVTYSILFATLGVTTSFPQRGEDFNEYFVHPNHRRVPSITPRIIGGQEVTPHEYPYQAGLYCNTTNGASFCGGSLVSKNYILTAAHCIEDAVSVVIILGAHRILEEESSQIRLISNEFIIHEAWNRSSLINDIAFIKLPSSVEENDYVQTVKIATGDDTYAGDLGTITGWGRLTNSQDGITPTLMYLISTILSNDDCKNIYPYETVVKPTHICLSGVRDNENVGTCNGDSGGPLTVNGIQIGVVSFGYRACDEGKPSVFTRLTEFEQWIRENSDVDI